MKFTEFFNKSRLKNEDLRAKLIGIPQLSQLRELASCSSRDSNRSRVQAVCRNVSTWNCVISVFKTQIWDLVTVNKLTTTKLFQTCSENILKAEEDAAVCLSVGWSVSQLTDGVLILSTGRIKPTLFHFFFFFCSLFLSGMFGLFFFYYFCGKMWDFISYQLELPNGFPLCLNLCSLTAFIMM